MIEYDSTENEKEQSAESSEEMKTEGMASTSEFSSVAQERMWMDQVRRECVKGYTNRIR